ncbi:MAG: SIMPL domain-containing protein [Patescibacteria group bacterium]
MQKFIKHGLFLVIVLAFFLVVVSMKTLKEYRYVGADIPPVNVISFSGKGEVIVIPDTATFTFGVTEEAKNVKDAQLKVTQKINLALARLKDLSIAEKNIKTISYNVYPKYEYEKQICTQYSCPPSRSTLVGYTVTQTIEVKVEDIDTAGAVLGAIGEVGATEISGLTFTSKDEEGQIREARKKAIEDAKQKASILAKDLGVRLVRIVNFSEGGSYPFYYRAAYGMGGAEKDVILPAPSLPIGENKVISEVTITYELGR